MDAIKVSRTLGQSQLNFAHTFFGLAIADESGLLSGFAPAQQPHLLARGEAQAEAAE